MSAAGARQKTTAVFKLSLDVKADRAYISFTFLSAPYKYMTYAGVYVLGLLLNALQAVPIISGGTR